MIQYSVKAYETPTMSLLVTQWGLRGTLLICRVIGMLFHQHKYQFLFYKCVIYRRLGECCFNMVCDTQSGKWLKSCAENVFVLCWIFSKKIYIKRSKPNYLKMFCKNDFSWSSQAGSHRIADISILCVSVWKINPNCSRC